MKLIIDAHLDLSWNALSFNRDLTEPVEQLRQREAGMNDHPSRGRSTTTLPELRRGGIAVCVATLLARAKRDVQAHRRADLDYATQSIAYAAAQGQLAYYRQLEEQGQIRMIRDRKALDAHWDVCERGGCGAAPVGCILSMEGADPIVSPRQAEAWWRDGLRAVGLAHYGQGHYAFGTGGTGPLTTQGVELLREFDRLGMILDLTHSSDPSFFEALELFRGPVLASHNNCRAIVPGDRQFSDEQIKRLIERGAVIGAVLDAWMLLPGYQVGKTPREQVPLERAADHIRHVCDLVGNSLHAAIGSDLDGGFGTEQSPAGIETIADLQKLDGILSSRGFSAQDVSNIFSGNWLRFFRGALPA